MSFNSNRRNNRPVKLGPSGLHSASQSQPLPYPSRGPMQYSGLDDPSRYNPTPMWTNDPGARAMINRTAILIINNLEEFKEKFDGHINAINRGVNVDEGDQETILLQIRSQNYGYLEYTVVLNGVTCNEILDQFIDEHAVKTTLPLLGWHPYMGTSILVTDKQVAVIVDGSMLVTLSDEENTEVMKALSEAKAENFQDIWMIIGNLLEAKQQAVIVEGIATVTQAVKDGILTPIYGSDGILYLYGKGNGLEVKISQSVAPYLHSRTEFLIDYVRPESKLPHERHHHQRDDSIGFYTKVLGKVLEQITP